MSEFDDKLNALLSDPDKMAQIMQLAQSISGSGTLEAEPAAAPPSPPTAPPPPQSPPNPAPNPNPLSALAGLSGLGSGLDPKLLAKLLPLVQELGSQQDSNARTLLYALRPYLKGERQEKVERALQLARLFHLGRKFLSTWEG